MLLVFKIGKCSVKSSGIFCSPICSVGELVVIRREWETVLQDQPLHYCLVFILRDWQNSGRVVGRMWTGKA